MTLLKMTELSLKRGSADYNTNNRVERVFRLVFSARPTNYFDFDAISSWAGIPARGDPYKVGDSRRLKNKSVAKGETAYDYIVICYYESSSDGTFLDDPLARPDEMGGDWQTELKPYFTDADGTKRLNSAGGFLEPRAGQRYAGQFGFTVKGNRAATTDLSLWASYIWPYCSYNAAPVTIRGVTIAAKKLLIKGMPFTLKTENTHKFFEFNFCMMINPDGWDKEIVEDRGFEDVFGPIWWQPDPTRPVEQAQFPWPLDGEGLGLADPTAAPADLEFHPYASKDFSVFGFTTAL